MYAVTITDPWKTKKVVAALKALPNLSMVRVVFDEGMGASEYKGVIEPIAQQTVVMGCLLDSQFMKTMNVNQFRARAVEYVKAFPEVPIWEVGNEINGEWLDRNKKRPDAMVKALSAFEVVKQAKKKTALTLYYSHPKYQDGNGDMIDWAEKSVPESMRAGLDYVLVSYYSQDNGGLEPSPEQWFAMFDHLAKLFPNAMVGIGECGLEKKPTEEYIKRYYSMKLSVPSFIGGFFYWYFCEQMLDTKKPLFRALRDAMK